MGDGSTGTGNPTGTAPSEAATQGGSEDANGVAPPAPPRANFIAAGGVKTGEQFANLMSALMSDVIEGRISPQISNAAVNAGGKLLKVVEMEYRYGNTVVQEPSSPKPSLQLATD